MKNTQLNNTCEKYDLYRNTPEIAIESDMKFKTDIKHKKTVRSKALKKRKPKKEIIDGYNKYCIEDKIHEDVGFTLI